MRRLGAALVVPFPDELGAGAWLFVENAGRSALAKLKRPLPRAIMIGPMARSGQYQRSIKENLTKRVNS